VQQSVLYQKRIGATRLEIASLDGECLGAVYFQASDRMFQDGAFDIVLEAAVAMLDALGTEEGLGALFLGPFEPVVPHGSERLEEARAAFADFQARLQGREPASVGELSPLSGHWLGREEGLALLRELAARAAPLSAEESSIRLLLLQKPEEQSSGWDLMHQNGATILGHWELNLRERPGSVDQRESPGLEFALEAARSVLERRLPRT
jgi:hypothetical protein